MEEPDLKESDLAFGPDDAIVNILPSVPSNEAGDAAETILKMYLGWYRSGGGRPILLRLRRSDLAGIEDAWIALPRVYSQVYSERGVHAICRVSPFDAKKRRCTTFTHVSVYPGCPVLAEGEYLYEPAGAGAAVHRPDRLVHKASKIVADIEYIHGDRKVSKLCALNVLSVRATHLAETDTAFGIHRRRYTIDPYKMVTNYNWTGEGVGTVAEKEPDADGVLSGRLLGKLMGGAGNSQDGNDDG